MSSKSIVIISGLVDATIKEYQPDIDFKIFKNIEELAEFVTTSPIRADLLFFTEDVVPAANISFQYLRDIVVMNDYCSVDKVIYICAEESQTISSYKYLIDYSQLSNWEFITGQLNRSFIHEVINGTYRDDVYNAKRRVVVRKPRADYVKQQLRNMDSLDESYEDDEHYLSDIPGEDIPEIKIEERSDSLSRVFISGNKSKERTAFSVLAAQYLARTDKVILVESDPDYHLVTEYVTKAAIPCSVITITDIYENVSLALENIRKAENNLVVIECIDRIDFNYKYIITLLYYNLMKDFNYIINEVEIDDLPLTVPSTIVVPSTITDILSVGEHVDKSLLRYCRFIGVDLKELPETHVSSGIVMSKLLNDILTENNIICPVVTISSLRLGNTAYDLGGILGRGVLL